MKRSRIANIKLSLFWLMQIASLFLTNTLQAQYSKINLSFKDAPVETVINEIRNQSEIDFIYNHEELKKCPKVSITIYNASIDEALTQTLSKTGFTFQKINEIIVIIPKKIPAHKPAETNKILSQTLRGTVIDMDSKMKIPYANVIVLNTNPVKGMVTDLEGNFKFEDLPIGRHSIRISYMGYKDAIIPELMLGSAKELNITVEISEEIKALGEISVSSKKGDPLNQMATVSARSFSVEETNRYAASISDPARMAQVFAGVSGNDDASNEIIIRGNSPSWMLWRLEGVEIPSPNHFSEEGYTSGAVSILSINMLSTSDFYTGAFPAEFGNAISGVFDIKLRNGNNEKTEYTIQAGVLGIDLSSEGPFKKGYRGSYLFNYRYSTLSLMNKLNIHVTQDALPNYQDLSFKINLPTKKTGTFSIWGIGGLSDVDKHFWPDTLSGEKFENGYSDFTQTGMYATGISHTYFPDQKSYFKTVVSHSQNYSSESYAQMDSTGNLIGQLDDRYLNLALRFNSFYNRKISKHLTIRTGITLNYLNYNYFFRENNINNSWKTYLNSKGRTNLSEGFFQAKYNFSDRLYSTAGIHYVHFALNGNNSLEPRIGLMMELKNRQKLSFGFGVHSKTESLPVYFTETENSSGGFDMVNKSLNLNHSFHYIAAYERMIGRDMKIKTEVYYQYINNLSIPTNPAKFLAPLFGVLNHEDTLSNTGKGKNYGLELTFQKFFTNDYYFLITSSIYDSKYMPANGRWYNTKYNSNYVNNFVGGKEFKWGENKLVSLNSKIIWSGGKRIIPVDLPASIAKGEAVLIMDELYSKKGKDYFRIDMGIRLYFFKEKSEHVISLDIQNITNRLNTWVIDFNSNEGKLFEYTMAGIIPILNYRVEF